MGDLLHFNPGRRKKPLAQAEGQGTTTPGHTDREVIKIHEPSVTDGSQRRLAELDDTLRRFDERLERLLPDLEQGLGKDVVDRARRIIDRGKSNVRDGSIGLTAERNQKLHLIAQIAGGAYSRGPYKTAMGMLEKESTAELMEKLDAATEDGIQEKPAYYAALYNILMARLRG